MLKLIQGSVASFFPKEMDAMFRNRAETFADRLGWEVVVKDGHERDRFDDTNPLYLVSGRSGHRRILGLVETSADHRSKHVARRFRAVARRRLRRERNHMGKFANLRDNIGQTAGSKKAASIMR